MTETAAALPPLDFIEPSERVTANYLLYGPAKRGKTNAAVQAPGPVLLCNADVGNATRFAHQKHEFREIEFRGVETLETLKAYAKAPDPPFKTIIIDPIADLYRILIEKQSGMALSPQIQVYGDAGTHLERFCRAMCKLPNVNFVVVAHDKPWETGNEGEVEFKPYTGSNRNPTLANKLLGMFDVIGYSLVIPPAEDGQAPRYMAQLRPANGRHAGDRFDVLDKLEPMDLGLWAEKINKAHGVEEAPAEDKAATAAERQEKK